MLPVGRSPSRRIIENDCDHSLSEQLRQLGDLFRYLKSHSWQRVAIARILERPIAERW
jgi:hypothetical protein